MRIFFNSTFMNEKMLNEAGIYHPIELEYYKIINKNEAKYGIHVTKKEYIKNEIKVENKKIQYITNDKDRIEKILTILKENEVTPIVVEDVVNDINYSLNFF